MKKISILLASLFATSSCGVSSADYKHVDNAEFSALIAREDVQLVDVRTSDEFAAGFIPGAMNIDVQGRDFDARITLLDTMRPVALYCRSGVRSRRAARKFAAKGFEVYNLKAGILGWNGSVECR